MPPVAGFEESIQKRIREEGREIRPNTYAVKIPVKAGEAIGKVGGSSLVVGFDWEVYDKNVENFFVHPEKYPNKDIHAVHFIQYCEESLKEKLLAKIPRTAEPRIGRFSYDQPGKLVGNWFLEGTTPEQAKTDWSRHLSFAYHHLDPSKILISIGGYLTEKPYTFEVYGNKPDPATIDVSSGKVVYWLKGADVNPDAPRITLLVQMIDDERIKVEVFKGWVKNPEFTENARIYTR